jgi:predicted MFS family arabinose efflux permease
VKIFDTFLLGLMTSLCSGMVPTLTAESIPKNPGTAMGFGKSAEQLGLFAGPILGEALIPVVGIACKIFVYGTFTILGTIMGTIMGSLIFAMTVREPFGLQ